MGGVQSELLQKSLEDYQDVTYLSRSEIIHIHSLYRSLGGADDSDQRLELSKVIELPQLKFNPFKKRICEVFSEDESNSGALNFEEFLDMFSVFHERAPLEDKIYYAFKIYDFDQDNRIGNHDLSEVVRRLCGLKDDNEDVTGTDAKLSPVTDPNDAGLSESEQPGPGIEEKQVAKIVRKIIKQADLDNDECISYYEFNSIVSRSTTFIDTFRMRCA